VGPHIESSRSTMYQTSVNITSLHNVFGSAFMFIQWLMSILCSQLEMMSEAIDETLDKDEAEEETEELTNQVN